MTTDYAQRVISKATRNIEHYRRLLAGDGLTEADQYKARIGIIHFVGVRFRARMILEMSKYEQSEII